MCITQCTRDQFDCNSGKFDELNALFQSSFLDCPCDTNCPNGCVSCDNSLCKKSVLILNTDSYYSIPMVVDFDGNVDDNLDFKIETMSRSRWACSVTLNGEFLVFGNGYQVNDQSFSVVLNYFQLSKVQDCKLQPVAEIPSNIDFIIDNGACATFETNAGIQKAYICFGQYKPDQCHT